MSLVTSLIAELRTNYGKTVGGRVVYEPLNLEFNDSLASGVAIDAADLIYVSLDTALTGSGTANLDVAGGLTDVFTATLTLIKVKLLYIHNKSTTAGNTIIVGNGANPLLVFGTGAHTHTIGPNGKLLIWEPSLAGKAVTATTGDNLLITNGTANAVTYDIVIVGTSS